jgi:hypothetical protein
MVCYHLGYICLSDESKHAGDLVTPQECEECRKKCQGYKSIKEGERKP